ncbi:MAG: hypothetical protein LBK52_03885, partial [Deltaproteobacteria bacterium]|nr:hypothetical protein [Deltaproteobacteria bacterium]
DHFESQPADGGLAPAAAGFPEKLPSGLTEDDPAPAAAVLAALNPAADSPADPQAVPDPQLPAAPADQTAPVSADSPPAAIEEQLPAAAGNPAVLTAEPGSPAVSIEYIPADPAEPSFNLPAGPEDPSLNLTAAGPAGPADRKLPVFRVWKLNQAQTAAALAGSFRAEAEIRPASAGEEVPGADQPAELSPEDKAVSDLIQELFSGYSRELIPLSPEQILQFRQKIERREKALAARPPKDLASRTESLRIEPGLKPPKVTVAPNLVTALIFTSPAGQPWPVISSVLGSGDNFKSEILAEAGHQVMVSALALRGHTNLLVTLRGLDQPLMISLEIVSAADESQTPDGLVNFRIENSTRPSAGQGKPVSPGLLLCYDLLEGKPFKSGTLLPENPSLPKSDIFLAGGRIYLRTDLIVGWPNWLDKAAGPGDYAVYELPGAGQLILINKDGSKIKISLTSEPVRRSD